MFTEFKSHVELQELVQIVTNDFPLVASIMYICCMFTAFKSHVKLHELVQIVTNVCVRACVCVCVYVCQYHVVCLPSSNVTWSRVHFI